MMAHLQAGRFGDLEKSAADGGRLATGWVKHRRMVHFGNIYRDSAAALSDARWRGLDEVIE
jgi:hypothetical protein